MSELPVRRVLWVLLAYGVVAAALLPALDAMARLLALPPVFGTLVRGTLALGVPLAVAVAWRYPEMGGSGERGPRGRSSHRSQG